MDLPRARSPGPTWSPGTSPTAATSPASTAISTPAARRRSARRPSPTAASWHRAVLPGHRRDRRLRARVRDHPDRRRAPAAPRHRRDRPPPARAGLWVVVGTNGVKITENLARILAEAGARGLSLSLDALDPERHDRFRRVRGAWQNTVEGAEILTRVGLPFIVQTTVGAHNRDELEAIADFAHDASAPRSGTSTSWCRPGAGRSCRTSRPRVRPGARLALPDPAEVRPPDAGQRQVRAALRQHPAGTRADSAGRRFARSGPTRGGAGGCPAGTHYLGIRPNGDVTPCPYLPLFAGTCAVEPARYLDVLGAVHRHPPAHLARRPLRPLRDQRPLRRLPRPRLRHDRRRDGRGSALHAQARHARRLARSWRSARHRPPAPRRRPGDPIRRRPPPTIAWDDAAGSA